MSWYRIDAKYGPGRHSGHVTYEWRDKMTAGELSQWVDDMREELSDFEYGPAIVNVSRVQLLPADEHQKLMLRAQNTVERSRALLVILSKTKTRRTR